jgi:hypothetical protein
MDSRVFFVLLETFSSISALISSSDLRFAAELTKWVHGIVLRIQLVVQIM